MALTLPRRVAQGKAHCLPDGSLGDGRLSASEKPMWYAEVDPYDHWLIDGFPTSHHRPRPSPR
jgi:hypothetical protein